MDAPACAVGRLEAGGPWVGFAPSIDDGYLLVVGASDHSARAAAEIDDLLALTVAYFEDALVEPPEELAATHADIGVLVRHLAGREGDANRRRSLDEAVDAIDDGLAADEVIRRLTRCFTRDEEPLARLGRRARQLAEEKSA
jgi:hypothetical protein